MLRCVLAVAAVAACSSTSGPPPVVDVPDGYTGPVALTIENHATATTIQSSPAGLDCPATCTAEFPLGSTVTLSFASRANYFVALWSKPCETVNGDSFTCQVTLTGPTTITAEGGQE